MITYMFSNLRNNIRVALNLEGLLVPAKGLSFKPFISARGSPIVCLHLSLFILAYGCPYGRVLQKSVSHFRFWRIVQYTERCPNSRGFSWFFSVPRLVFNTHTRYLDFNSRPKDWLVILVGINNVRRVYKSRTLTDWAMRGGYAPYLTIHLKKYRKTTVKPFVLYIIQGQ
jgi:hypothetical protein